MILNIEIRKIYSNHKENTTPNSNLDLFWGDKDLFKGEFENMAKYLSETESNRLNRLKIKQLSETYITSHFFLRKAISEHLNIGIKKVDIIFEEGHKPYINSQSLDFNLSHSDNYFAFVIGFGANDAVGIDIEKIKYNLNIEGIVNYYMHRLEVEYIFAGEDNNQRHIRFFEIWTRKEALLKMIGIGLVDHLSEVNVITEYNNVMIEVPDDFKSHGDKAYLYTFIKGDFIMSAALSFEANTIVTEVN